jgi:DNA-binding transcriptional MerR regulator
MSETGRPVYSISAVARMVGVPAATIRTWEDRYGLVVPARNVGGHRLYRRDQVEQLRFVRTRMTGGGLSAADAHRVLAERIAAAAPLASQDSSRSQLILLAGYDPHAVEYEEYYLKAEGFEVGVTLTKDAARRYFSKNSPSLVLVDLLISGGAGLDLCRFFKERGDVPVVAVSVLDFGDLAPSAGADAFLLKPLEPQQLVSTVRDLLGLDAYVQPVAESVP